MDKKITTLPLPANEIGLLKNINGSGPNKKGYWFTSVKGFCYYDIYNNRLTDLSFIIKERSGQENTGFIVDLANAERCAAASSTQMAFDSLAGPTAPSVARYGASVVQLMPVSIDQVVVV